MGRECVKREGQIPARSNSFYALYYNLTSTIGIILLIGDLRGVHVNHISQTFALDLSVQEMLET